MTYVTVTFTEAQARAVNNALAYCTSGDPEDGGLGDGPAGQRRFQSAIDARAVLARAMTAKGVTA